MEKVIYDVLNSIEKKGYEAYIVGGYVREHILKHNTFDIDITTSAKPKELVEIFKDYDAVILPVGTGPAKHLDGSLDILDDNTSALEEHLQIGNFGGFPSITIPNGFVSDLPVGVNITGNCYDDANVLNIAYALEGAMDYKDQIAKEVRHD